MGRFLRAGTSRRARIRLAVALVAVAVGVGFAVWQARRAGPAVIEVGADAKAPRAAKAAPVAQGVALAVADEPTVSCPAAPRATGTSFGAQPIPETLRRQGATTIAEALAVAKQLPDSEDRSLYIQGLLRYCLEVDPAATAAAVAAFRDEKLRDHGMSFLLGAWAERDAPAALAWAAAHPRAENDSTWFCAAYEGFAAKRPSEALTMLQRPELSADADALARIVAFHLDEQGRIGDARVAIEQMPAGAARDALVSQVAHFWALRAPADAAGWLASSASDATFREGMATIVQTLASTQPTFAAGLARRFPDDRSGHDLLGDVVYLWAKRDLGGAAAWLRAQAPGPNLDGAVARMIEATAPNDPNEAREWLAKISDPEKRGELANRLGL